MDVLCALECETTQTINEKIRQNAIRAFIIDVQRKDLAREKIMTFDSDYCDGTEDSSHDNVLVLMGWCALKVRLLKTHNVATFMSSI